MVKIYVRKIREKAVNSKTGEVWVVDDVPEKWRVAVAKELEKYEDMSAENAKKKVGREGCSR